MAKAVEAFFFSDHGFFQMLLFFGNPNTIHGTSLYTLRKIHDMVDVYGPETSFNGRLDFAGIFG